MFLIMGINTGRKQLGEERMVICSRCGKYGRYEVILTYTYFSLFFIPLFKWNKQYFVTASCCGAIFSLDPGTGQRMARGETVPAEEWNLTLLQNGSGQGGYGGQIQKHCLSCGYETDADFEFCPKCGKRF